MSSQLLPVWGEIEKYLDDGISVFPVRDRQMGDYAAKTPFGSWKQYQSKIIKKEELFELMDVKYDTTAVAIVTGKVSGGIEVIDVDVKYNPGIDATLFSDLKLLYPDLLKRLRIHKTPSGGYHIFYRCDRIDGNQKLSAREKTEDEIKRKPLPKIVNFIETRGEGGYVLAPPSLGYKVVRDVQIQMISESERASLLNLCRSYNKVVKTVTLRGSKNQNYDYYDTDPFTDYNLRVDPTELAESFGWKFYKEAGKFIWYTRPGKMGGVSMSFNLEKRFFFCFTSSTELEENKGYSPTTLMNILGGINNTKELYKKLVSLGYGKIKESAEKRMVKSSVLNGKPLPPNVSTKAVVLRDEISKDIEQTYPYGTFWIDSPDKGIAIDREKLYTVADQLGFRLYDDDTLTYSDNTYVEEVSERFFYDKIKEYIREEDADLYKDICNAYESFIEKHGSFTISRLRELRREDVLRDTKESCYKVYQNGILHITKEKIELLDKVPLLIWKSSIKKRNYNNSETGRYIEFLKMATDYDVNREYIMSCIGYLSHEYKDETTGYIIVLTEQCEDPKDGGGAGKNVFSSLFRETTTFTGKPGEQVSYDEKFLQSWNGEKIFCISDVPKNFKFSFLKELSTGSGLIKKLFKNEREVIQEDMPKFLIQTNYSVEITDGGLRRRVKIIEFTDFFTRAGGVDVHFNAYFPNDWSEEDWAGYDGLMANSVQLWLRNGRKIGKSVLSETGWAKQFEQTYGQLVTGFIKEYLERWCERKEVDNDKFQEELDTYMKDNGTPVKFKPTSNKINAALAEYCGHAGIDFSCNVMKRVNGISRRVRQFGDEEDVPF